MVPPSSTVDANSSPHGHGRPGTTKRLPLPYQPRPAAPGRAAGCTKLCGDGQGTSLPHTQAGLPLRAPHLPSPAPPSSPRRPAHQCQLPVQAGTPTPPPLPRHPTYLPLPLPSLALLTACDMSSIFHLQPPVDSMGRTTKRKKERRRKKEEGEEYIWEDAWMGGQRTAAAFSTPTVLPGHLTTSWQLLPSCGQCLPCTFLPPFFMTDLRDWRLQPTAHPPIPGWRPGLVRREDRSGLTTATGHGSALGGRTCLWDQHATCHSQAGTGTGLQHTCLLPGQHTHTTDTSNWPSLPCLPWARRRHSTSYMDRHNHLGARRKDAGRAGRVAGDNILTSLTAVAHTAHAGLTHSPRPPAGLARANRPTPPDALHPRCTRCAWCGTGVLTFRTDRRSAGLGMLAHRISTHHVGRDHYAYLPTSPSASTFLWTCAGASMDGHSARLLLSANNSIVDRTSLDGVAPRADTKLACALWAPSSRRIAPERTPVASQAMLPTATPPACVQTLIPST